MTGLGHVTRDEMTMHIHNGNTLDATTVVANESPQAWHLFQTLTRTIGDCLDADALSKVPKFNRTVAAILGTNRMDLLERAQAYWRWMRLEARAHDCHACDRNDGGYATITIDWAQVAAVGSICESCFVALGLDGDRDE